MAEYIYIINDPSTYPVLAWNEVVVSAGVYDISLLTPIHNVDIYPHIAGYNRMQITTKFLDMTSRGEASAYHGALAPIKYARPSVKYVPSQKYLGKSDFGLDKLSPVGRSLTSKPRTGGKKTKLVKYRPQKGRKCRPGFVEIDGYCIRRNSKLAKELRDLVG